MQSAKQKVWAIVNRERRNAQARARRQRNPEKVRAYQRAWRQAHPSTLEQLEQDRLRRQARYKPEDPTKKRDRMKLYNAAHPEKQRIHVLKRRAMRKAATTIPYTAAQLIEHVAKFGNQCAYCGLSGSLHMDHFVPLSRGGENSLANLVPACPACNQSKSWCDPLEWYYRQAFFSQGHLQHILEVLGRTASEIKLLPVPLRAGSANGKAVLDELKVAQIKTLLVEGLAATAIAKVFKVSNGTVQAIKENRTWKHVNATEIAANAVKFESILREATT